MVAHPIEFVASSLLGLLVNFLSLAVVQATSSLTLKVLNTARCVALVAVGMLFYGEVCSPLELFGYAIALLGFALYNWAQMYPEGGEQLELLVRRRCFCREVAVTSNFMGKGDITDEEDPPPATSG